MALGKISLLGSAGMLGTDVYSKFVGLGWEVTCFCRPEFDFTNIGDIEVAVEAGDIIINCAAYTNVDGAEQNKRQAFAVNAHSVGKLSALVKRKKKFLIHISTDFVYNGMKQIAYTEEDYTDPINVYGRSKLHGEELIRESACKHCILRVEWTYGRNGKNFVNKICERARALPSIKVVDDQVGSPTATWDIAETIQEIAQKQVEGLYLYAARGDVSRFEVANYLVKKLGLKSEVHACNSSEFQTSARRPLNSKFDCSLIDKVIKKERVDWRCSMDQFLNQAVLF